MSSPIFTSDVAGLFTDAAFRQGLKRLGLVSLIERQLDKWPLPKGKLSKVNKPDLKAKLLDPALGFTTNEPLPGSHNTASIAAVNPADDDGEGNVNGNLAVNLAVN